MSNQKVELSEEEAKKWLVFQEHYAVFHVLVRNQVFIQKNAAVTLNFDHNGILQTIERRDTMYSARFK